MIMDAAFAAFLAIFASILSWCRFLEARPICMHFVSVPSHGLVCMMASSVTKNANRRQCEMLVLVDLMAVNAFM